MYLKHKSSYFVTTKMNRFFIVFLLFLGTSFVHAQKVYVPKTTPFKDKTKGVNIDSLQQDTTTKVRNTEVNYDVSDLFNLDLSESERAQAKAIIEVFSEQIDEDSSNIGAYINRGSYWATLGLHVQAIKDYDKAIDIITSGGVDADTIITDVSPLSDIQAAFEALDSSPTAMKSLIRVGNEV